MSTQLFLAACSNSEVLKQTFDDWDWVARPLNILVTFPFVKLWRRACQPHWATKATMLDSGAYSAWKSGEVIDFDKLCTEARDGGWNEAVGLDVIGDPVASAKNCQLMKARGLSVMPVFHFGDPWHLLAEYCSEYQRVGLSCRFGEPHAQSMRWLEQCFARAYPARFHSFGWVKREMLLTVPFATADTASWHSGVRFGHSKFMRGLKIPRKSQAPDPTRAYDLRYDVMNYLRLEEEVQDKWRKELAWITQTI